jgi:hypothetical protein
MALHTTLTARASLAGVTGVEPALDAFGQARPSRTRLDPPCGSPGKIDRTAKPFGASAKSNCDLQRWRSAAHPGNSRHSGPFRPMRTRPGGVPCRPARLSHRRPVTGTFVGHSAMDGTGLPDMGSIPPRGIGVGPLGPHAFPRHWPYQAPRQPSKRTDGPRCGHAPRFHALAASPREQHLPASYTCGHSWKRRPAGRR